MTSGFLALQEKQRPVAKQAFMQLMMPPNVPDAARETIWKSLFTDGFDCLLQAFTVALHATGKTGADLIDPADKRTNLQSTIARLFFCFLWVRNGMPIFNLTHSLAAVCLLTDPPSVNADDFKFSFSAYTIRIPSGFISFTDINDHQPLWVDTIHVSRVKEVNKDGLTVERVRLDLISEDGKQFIWHVARGTEPFTEKSPGSVPDETGFLEDKDMRALQMAARVVLNLQTWIDCNGKGEKANSRKDVKGKAPAREVPAVWIVGKEVKLGVELRRLASEFSLGEKRSPPGWKLRMRFCVRGHWKMQPCGPGGTERKRIFVEPYWKGPEGAAAWQHVYKAGEENH